MLWLSHGCLFADTAALRAWALWTSGLPHAVVPSPTRQPAAGLARGRDHTWRVPGWNWHRMLRLRSQQCQGPSQYGRHSRASTRRGTQAPSHPRWSSGLQRRAAGSTPWRCTARPCSEHSWAVGNARR